MSAEQRAVELERDLADTRNALQRCREKVALLEATTDDLLQMKRIESLGRLEAVRKLEHENARVVARDRLLWQLNEWDHMDTAADGAFWRGQIAHVLND